MADEGERVARTEAVARGVIRLWDQMGFGCVRELSLANNRRADIVALSPKGELVLIEIKSCWEDFRVDTKWEDYAPYCDRMFFAVDARFPHDRLPQDRGLIVADAYGGAIVRQAPAHPLPGARRKAVTLRFAALAARRLARIEGLTTVS
jgi:hypothetical protein